MTSAFAANLFAFRSAVPEARREVQSRLQQDPNFNWVGAPGPQWIAGLAPLPPRAPPPVTDSLVVAQDTAGVFNSLDPNERSQLLDLVDKSPERFAQLAGDFTFLRCHQNGTATVVRAVGGAMPVFLWRHGSSAAVSSCLSFLVRFLDATFALDLLVLASHASGSAMFPGGRGPLRNVTVLPRGHFALIDDETRVRRYWSPPAPERRSTPSTFAEHAVELRARLLGSLEDCVVPRGNLLSLSGGVDSSALASLLMGTLGRPLSTVTFLPDATESLEHELGFVRPLLKRYAHQVQQSWQFPFGPNDRLRYLEHAPRVVTLVTHPVLQILPDLTREEEIQVLFGGEFADELFGSMHTFPDWAHNTTALQLLLHPFRIPSGPRRAVGWARHQINRYRGRPALVVPASLAPLYSDELQTEYREWYAAEQARLAADRRPRAFLVHSFEQGVDVATAMNWEVASAFGIRRCFPLLGRDLLELVFRCPVDEAQGRMSKRLLRRALQQDVAPHNLFRPDKGRPVTRPPTWVEWDSPIPDEIRPAVRPIMSLGDRLPLADALHLRTLLNMVEALSTSTCVGAE